MEKRFKFKVENGDLIIFRTMRRPRIPFWQVFSFSIRSCLCGLWICAYVWENVDKSSTQDVVPRKPSRFLASRSPPDPIANQSPQLKTCKWNSGPTQPPPLKLWNIQCESLCLTHDLHLPASAKETPTLGVRRLGVRNGWAHEQILGEWLWISG